MAEITYGNEIKIFGTLSKDPEYKESTSGSTYVKFSVYSWKKTEKVDGQKKSLNQFFNCTGFHACSTTMQFADVKKGSKLIIVGRLEIDNIHHRDTGAPMTFISIIVNSVIITDDEPKKESGYGLDSDPVSAQTSEFASRRNQQAPEHLREMAGMTSQAGIEGLMAQGLTESDIPDMPGEYETNDLPDIVPF